MLYRARWLAGLAVAAALSSPAPARADAKPRAEGARTEAKSKAEGARGEVKAKDEGEGAKAPGRSLPLAISGLRWGMTRTQLEECVNRKIDADSLEARKRASGAPALRNLEAQVAAQKAAFQRSYLELSEGPDGFDTSPLVGEFSKGNGEALMRLPAAAGGRIWFFLIGDRLWKTYEEVPQGPGVSRADALDEAVKRARASAGGRAPKVLPAAPAKGRPAPVHEWEDATTHVRLWDRGAGFVALVHEERAMLARLPEVRKKVARAPSPADEGLSPAVAAALKGVEKTEKKGGEKTEKKGGAPRKP